MVIFRPFAALTWHSKQSPAILCFIREVTGERLLAPHETLPVGGPSETFSVFSLHVPQPGDPEELTQSPEGLPGCTAQRGGWVDEHGSVSRKAEGKCC